MSVKKESAEVNPFKIYIYIQKHMSYFFFLSRYASEDFLILPFVVIYIHIRKKYACVCAFARKRFRVELPNLIQKL